MVVGSKRAIHYVLWTAVAFLILTRIPLAYGQAANSKPAQKPLMAEDVFKNVQLLKGIPVKEFMDTMGFFSAATGMNCIDCHSPQAADSLAEYAIDTPLKQTARKMMLMVNTLNKGNFGGQRKVTCYTCHRATDHPEAIPSLLDQYSVAPDDPDKAEIAGNGGTQPVNKMSADQILDKYIQAIGGAPQLAKLTSFVAKGTYEGFDSLSGEGSLRNFCQRPQSAHHDHPCATGRQRQYVRRQSWMDRCIGQTDARAPAFRRRSGWRQNGRVSLFSGAHQARVQVAHGLPFGRHRR